MRRALSIPLAALLCALVCAVSFADPPKLTADELEQGISNGLMSVDEFRFLREQAARLKVKVYLFGGTAAAYAHYVKWHLQQQKGDGRYQKDRFDYDYTNIFRSTQDLDIVVDGPPEAAMELERLIREKFRYLMGSKSAWEVRLLKEKLGDKDAILGDPDFHNQHTDSNSTGLIEISVPQRGEPVVRDARDWGSHRARFFQDVLRGQLHYYFSDKHETTSRFKAGKNPPIVSAIRYLTKAFQYELEIPPEDWVILEKIVHDFNPERDIVGDYLPGWIGKNGKKILQHAVNMEYAVEQLDKLGLREKLKRVGDPRKKDSLAWWMSKAPLESKAVGLGDGQTAEKLGITEVAHETNSFLAYESITRSHKGEPNVFISRDGVDGEVAVHGNGFYTKVGREGARGTGLTIRFRVKPGARLNHDFKIADTPKGRFIIFLNRNALEVIPESLDVQPIEYFEMLARGETFDPADLALVEKLKRKIGPKLTRIDEPGQEKILALVREAVGRPMNKGHNYLLREWLSFEASARSPEILTEAVAREVAEPGSKERLEILLEGLSSPHWASVPAGADALFSLGRSRASVESLLRNTLSRGGWAGNARAADFLIEAMKKYDLDLNVAEFVLSKPEWASTPGGARVLETLLSRGRADWAVVKHVLSKGDWAASPKAADALAALIKKGSVDGPVAEYVLGQPEWRRHPRAAELVGALVDKGVADTQIIEHVLSHGDLANPEALVAKLLSRPQNRIWLDTFVPGVIHRVPPAGPPPTRAELETAIGSRLTRIEELRFVREEAAKLKLRVWLFGGTAEQYAHHVHEDLKDGGKEYGWDDVFRAKQDIDLAAEGPAEAIAELKRRLLERYPRITHHKSLFMIRELNADIADNPLIELTDPPGTEARVRSPRLVEELASGTSRFRLPRPPPPGSDEARTNPPIHSVVRYLANAFRYGLKIPPEDLETIKGIVEEPDAERPGNFRSYWLQNNAKLLFSEALDIEAARKIIVDIGLMKYLKKVQGDMSGKFGLDWWLHAELLSSSPLGTEGNTAADLGLSILTYHGNRYRPGALANSEGLPNEVSDTTYTENGAFRGVSMEPAGTEVRNSFQTVRYVLSPQAREGHDFVLDDGRVIVKNRAALRVLPERPDIGLVPFFQLVDSREAAALCRKQGRVHIDYLDASGVAWTARMVREHAMNSDHERSRIVLEEWLASGTATRYPEVVEAMLSSNPIGRPMPELRSLVRKALAQPHWRDAPTCPALMRALDAS